MKQEKPLKAKQHAAIRLLAQGESQKNVANILHVAPMTVYRWNCMPAFHSQLQTITASETGLEALARKINAAGLTAIENAQEILAGINVEPIETRLKAAQIILRSLPAINAAIERGLKHHRADFNLEQRWEKGDTFDGNCDLIPEVIPGANPSVRNANGGVVV